MKNIKPTIRSYGSCATRGCIHHAKRVTFCHNIGFNSILTATGERTPIAVNKIDNVQPWEAKMLQLDFDKSVPDFIEKFPTEFCAIDLIDERYNLVQIGGSWILDSAQYRTSKCDDVFKKYRKQIIEQEYLDEHFIKSKINEFCDMITRYYEPRNIIINECYMVYKYVDIDGEIKEFEDKDYINRFNNYVYRYYNYLIKRLKGCYVIKMPKDTLGDAKHFWGKSPVHYTEEFYNNLTSQIEKYIFMIYESKRGKISNYNFKRKENPIFSLEKIKKTEVPEYIAKYLFDLLNYFTCKSKRILQIGLPCLNEALLDYLGIEEYVVLSGGDKSLNDISGITSGFRIISRDNYMMIDDVLTKEKRCIYLCDEYDIQNDFFGKFDMVISCSYIEHAKNLSFLLDVAYQCLKKKGVLWFTGGPIWSSNTGSKWRINEKYFFGNNEKLLDFPHLLMTIDEIKEQIENLISDNTMATAEQIKNGGRFMNRLFYEDYERIMDNTLFAEKGIKVNVRKEIADSLLLKLQEKFEGYYRFDVKQLTLCGIK